MPKGPSRKIGKARDVEPQGPEGVELPPADTRRWVPRRKAAVVAAVERGVLTAEDACRRYDLTKEEFEIWKQLFRRYGRKGLRVTHLHQYRGRPQRPRATAAGSSKMTTVIGGGPGFF